MLTMWHPHNAYTAIDGDCESSYSYSSGDTYDSYGSPQYYSQSYDSYDGYDSAQQHLMPFNAQSAVASTVQSPAAPAKKKAKAKAKAKAKTKAKMSRRAASYKRSVVPVTARKIARPRKATNVVRRVRRDCSANLSCISCRMTLTRGSCTPCALV